MCFQLLLPEQSHVVLYIIFDYMAKLLRQTVRQSPCFMLHLCQPGSGSWLVSLSLVLHVSTFNAHVVKRWLYSCMMVT